MRASTYLSSVWFELMPKTRPARTFFFFVGSDGISFSSWVRRKWNSASSFGLSS